MSEQQNAEKVALDQAIGTCPECEHHVIWHHDHRGCGWYGYTDRRCPCELTTDAAIERIIAERVASEVRTALQEAFDVVAAQDYPANSVGYHPEAYIAQLMHRATSSLPSADQNGDDHA